MKLLATSIIPPITVRRSGNMGPPRRDSGLVFQYKALDATRKEIRLLHVRPGKRRDGIVCSLRHVSLVEVPKPDYETISYRWGDATNLASIKLDNAVRQIPASSAAAIRRARHPDTPRILWIDAVCINQKDNKERAQQVAMMGDVYSCSDGNLVYLGEDEGWATQAVQSIEAITAEIALETNHFQSIAGTPFDRGVSNRQRSSSGSNCRIHINALKSFLLLPRFQSAFSPSSLYQMSVILIHFTDVSGRSRKLHLHHQIPACSVPSISIFWMFCGRHAGSSSRAENCTLHC